MKLISVKSTLRASLFILLACGLSVFTVGCSDDKDDPVPAADASTTEAAAGDGETAASADSGGDAAAAPESDTSAGSDERSANTGSRVILCIGDSITEGVGTSDPYPSKLARITGDRVINAGVTSQRSDQGLRRIQGEINRVKPTHVCILYGTNDVRVESTGSTISNLQGMINAVRSSGAKAIVGTLPPLNERGGSQQGTVDSLNGRIRGLSGASIADIARDFGGGAGTLNGDGIHPNNNGAAIIAANFSERL